MTTPSLNSHLLVRALSAAHLAILEHKEEIAALDGAIGDGDHVFNLLRGLEATLLERDALAQQDLATSLKSVAKKLLESVGGSAGPLLASLFLGMAKAVREPITPHIFAGMVENGVQAMCLRGKAGLGEKTMLDVLIPVAECLGRLAQEGAPLEVALERVRQTAEAGMRSTQDMVATKGRAAFLGERSRGVIDPGARSSQVMIAAICDVLTPSTAPV